jgi:hypothetical protein
MRIELTIYTDEPYSSFDNVKDLITMAVEEVEENRYAWRQPFNGTKEVVAKTKYLAAGKLWASAAINLIIDR